MALNFGAPGDRRDAHGKLWLAYPRPIPNTRLKTSLDLSLKLETKFLSQGAFFSRDGDSVERSSSELAWVVSSGGRGLARCSIPLLGKNDKPARYTVRLHFSGEQADQSGQRIFDVRLQGKTVLQNVDVSSKPQSHEVTGVEVTENLVIELISKSKKQDSSSLPILNGIEIQRVSRSQ